MTWIHKIFSRRKINPYVDPEDIFLDTRNSPGFDTIRFEGRLERPISRPIFAMIGILFALVGSTLFARAAYLGILHGDEFQARATNNHLRHTSIVPPRGVIYDRNLRPLAYNVPGFRISLDLGDARDSFDEANIIRLASLLKRDPKEVVDILAGRSGEIPVDIIYEWDTANAIIAAFKDDMRVKVEPATIREYLASPSISHVVGYLSKITKEDLEVVGDSPFLWLQRGRTGIELTYDEILRGTLGKKIVEFDSGGEPLSENLFEREEPGKNLVLSISADLQEVMYQAVGETVRERGFTGGSAIMLDARNGAVLGLVSYPGYDLNALSRGSPRDAVRWALQDASHPLFNLVISSAYPPASTVKPFLAAAALEEHIIDPNRQILTNGKIVVPNPYDPAHPATFLDWKNHGLVDMFQAIAVSSNAYFQTIGGGYGGIPGLGLSRIHEYMSRFGFGSKTGIDIPGEFEGLLPDEAWKARVNPGDPTWRIGDTYNISIGQGGTLATPVQLAVAALAMVNKGDIIKPKIALGLSNADGTVEYFSSREVTRTADIAESSLRTVQKGMRLAVQEGTAKGLSEFSVEIAAKTGTAQFIRKEKVHSWFMGFAPYDNPEVILVINMENASAHNLIGGVYVAGQIFRWYDHNRDKLFTLPDKAKID